MGRVINGTVFFKYAMLSNDYNLNVELELLELFTHCFWELIDTHKNDKITVIGQREAKLEAQMILSKLLHLKKLLEGSCYVNQNQNTFIDKLIDPTIIIAYVRNIFEMVCKFHIVYKAPNTEDKRKILYNLWVIAGLQYRQKFITTTSSFEYLKKAEKERQDIENLTKEIKETALFANLTERNRNKIVSRLDRKEYKIKIDDNNNVKCFNWQEVANEFLKTSDSFKAMYTFFSLHAHPSYISVIQFKDMFKDEKETMSFIIPNVQFALALSSIFLTDLISVFPQMLSTFEKRNIFEQGLLNLYNSAYRGEEYSINNAFFTASNSKEVKEEFFKYRK